jgi:hypothetical protein
MFTGNGNKGFLEKTLANLILHEYDPSTGYTREVIADANVAAGGYTIGDLVDATGVKIVAGKENETYGIVLQNFVKNQYDKQTADVLPAILVRGAAIVNENCLNLDGLTKATVITTLAAKGILVRSSYDVKPFVNA